jgi:ribonuclease P protein component
VTSKKVGKAVVRNRARRRLRALFMQNEHKIKSGKYIFVAKASLNERNFEQLKKDFNFAFKRLELYK